LASTAPVQTVPASSAISQLPGGNAGWNLSREPHRDPRSIRVGLLTSLTLYYKVLCMSNPTEPQDLLAQVDRLRSATRQTLMLDSWLPFLVWAAVCFGALISYVIPSLLPSRPYWVTSYYWLVGAPAGMVATIILGIRSDRRRPVRRGNWPYWVVGSVIAAFSFSLGALPHPEALVVTLVVFGVGFAVFCLIERRPVVSAVLLITAVGAGLAALAVDDRFELYPVLSGVFAVILVAAGMWDRFRSR